MNIFPLDPNPHHAAGMMCDKHVVKMLLETAQLLCTTHRVLTGAEHMYDPVSGVCQPLYKSTHVNHPCVKWLTEYGDEAYVWLYRHFHGLDLEYTNRYMRTHASMRLRNALSYTPSGINICDNKILSQNARDEHIIVNTMPQCMPDQYKVPGDTVQAYRNYYNGDKSRFAKWKYSEVPDWFNPNPIGVYNA